MPKSMNGALTIGNVVFVNGPTQDATADRDLMMHEITHSIQSAKYGALFPGLWSTRLQMSILTGNYPSSGGGCWNPVEREAGAWACSMYRECNW